MGYFDHSHTIPQIDFNSLLATVAITGLVLYIFVDRGQHYQHYHRFRTDSNEMRETYTPMPANSEPYLQDLRDMGGFF